MDNAWHRAQFNRQSLSSTNNFKGKRITIPRAYLELKLSKTEL